jgi:ApbE superfamily uncharacterized protein (UPF0280 family)
MSTISAYLAGEVYRKGYGAPSSAGRSASYGKLTSVTTSQASVADADAPLVSTRRPVAV